MIPNINSRQARQMMQKMGIQQEELDAVEVIIKFADKEIVISNPQVTKVNMMGQDTYQVVGEASQRLPSAAAQINPEDVSTVAQAAGVSNAEALKAIADSKGDLAEAILRLKND